MRYYRKLIGMRTFGLFALALILLASCKSSSNVPTGAEAYRGYSEDLSSSLTVYPDYEEQLNNQPVQQTQASALAVDEKLEERRKELVEQNESEPYFDGFTVLVYSGLNREEAFEAQEELEKDFPDLNAQMQYEQPRYLLKVGQYLYRFEAQKNYALIKEKFPTARIVLDRIQREDFKAKKENVEGEN